MNKERARKSEKESQLEAITSKGRTESNERLRRDELHKIWGSVFFPSAVGNARDTAKTKRDLLRDTGRVEREL